MEELRREAEKLAEERRLAREQAMEWTREIRVESDEERERKATKKSRKPKPEGVSGDEAEPKKKRRGKLRKTNDQEDGEEQAVFSDEEDMERPAKKVRFSFGIQFAIFCLNVEDREHQIRSGWYETRMTTRWLDHGKSNCMFSLSVARLGNDAHSFNFFLARAKRCCRIQTTKCHDHSLSLHSYSQRYRCIALIYILFISPAFERLTKLNRSNVDIYHNLNFDTEPERRQ